MSKIDLSKAKIGDKFRLKNGVIATYKCYSNYSCAHAHILESGLKLYVANCDGTEANGIHEYDVIEQVLDKPLDELIEEGTKQIKENDDAIADKQELQRRKEVVELAEKMYIILEAENFKYYLCNNGNNAFESEELMRLTFVRADTFINKKHQYLKEGKL